MENNIKAPKAKSLVVKFVFSILFVIFIFSTGYVFGRIGYKLNTTTFKNIKISNTRFL